MNDDLEQAIRATIGNAIATHFIIVVEVMTPEGMDLRIGSSDSLTPWQASGMLEVAKEMITDAQYPDFDDEDDNK